MTTTNDGEQTISHIAQALKESEGQPLAQLRTIVERFGSEFALKALEETLKVEEQGGLMINDGSRKRTPGGVFFYLVRGRIPRKDVAEIFYKGQKPQPKQPAEEDMFRWGDRMTIARELMQEKGEAKVKVTLIGRPGKVVEKQQFVITMIRDSKVPSLPKGMPRPPADPTSFMVYISKKQWSRVKESLQNPEDVLIVEGFARYDPELEGMAVFALNTITKLSQQKQRQAQKDQAQVEQPS